VTLAVQDALGVRVEQLPLTGERICQLLDGIEDQKQSKKS
jgi:CO/xanthine dehydrogenase Mo-binding subunit